MENNKYSINIDRIINDMEHINAITATPGKGSTRFSYSPQDKEARAYIQAELEKLNIEMKVDGAGNIRALYDPEETKLPSVMIGSHIDTVPSGGRFDGLAGTISALEVIRTAAEHKIAIKHPIELVIFAEEEGSNFGSTTLGSKVMTGKVTKEDLKKSVNSAGESAYDVMKEFGLDVETIGDDIITSDELKAMLEIHIEQGGVLEREEKSIGIVNSIAGMNTYSVVLKGLSNHAGTAPMIGRRDPLVGAARIILAMEEFARTKVNDTTVATIGKLECFPSGSNVINNEVRFNVDIRDIKQEGIDKTSAYLEEFLAETAADIGLEYTIDKVGSSSPAILSDKLVNILEAKAKERDMQYRVMHSGAVHDSMMMADITDVCMIFVPSKDGISHNPDEYTSYEDIEFGANLLLETVIELSNE